MRKLLLALLILIPAAARAQWLPVDTGWQYIQVPNPTASGGGSITGGTCTDQVVTAIDTSGVPTCATIDLTTATVTGINPSTKGGTANGFTKFSGPASTEKTFTLPNASANIFTDATATDDTVPVMNGTTFQLKALPTCTDTGGNHLNYDASTNTFSCGTTGDGAGTPNVTTTVYQEEEFTGTRTAVTSTCAGAGISFFVTNNGTGAGNNNAVVGTANHPGICQWDTGTSNGSGSSVLAALQTGSVGGDLFSGTETLEWSTCVTALSDANDIYTVRMGFGDQTDGTAPTDGCWFEYTNGTNSGNWVGTCKNNAGPTSTNTNVAPTVCPTFQRLRIAVNSNATAVTFSTDGTASAGGTVGANIPTAAGREFGLMFGITKTGGAVGTTSRKFQLDYVEWTKTVSR